MTKKDKDLEYIFRETFGTQDGKTMLWWIADQCGFFSERPEQISPVLLSFFHRLLKAGGINTPQKAGILMDRLMEVSAEKVEIDKENDGYDI